MIADSAWDGLAWSVPWWLVLVATAWRWRDSPSLEDEPDDAPVPAPLLSVIVPARNEGGHIEACVRAILSTRYPSLELIVVDDHSADATASAAVAGADGDARLTLLQPAALPAGWLGKQWACHAGAAVARGDFLLFTDADVRHAPDLHARLVRTALASGADLVSVAGFQETRTFWERVVQPFVFAILALWYGGPGAVNRSRNPRRKIANGQCLCFTRSAYERFGGHVTVCGKPAEDLAFAQLMTTAGMQVRLTVGTRQLSTRMYGSLREIVAGWGKNVYSAGRETLPAGATGHWLARLLVPAPALAALVPVFALAAGVIGAVAPAWLWFGCSASAALTLAFLAIGREFALGPWYALTFPLGAAVYLYIAVRAVARGDHVEWKGRAYQLEG
jgi:chlorobactene glucosyltransferase